MPREPIAIVGIGCRFPGASGPAEFWQLLAAGVDAITEIPHDRFDADGLYDATPATPGRIMSRWGGFLDGIDRFDAAFFGISPREADRLDPQQRLLLEVAWEALDDGGQLGRPLAGTQTGVFLGMWLNEYEARLFRDPSAIDFYMTTGSGRYSASGRISYAFGFEGPSLTVDTACSSSLVAVHLACQSLWTGENTLALAGGANLILEPSITIAYSQSRMMAPDGRCKFADARANGYVRSDGVGIVVLKPLARALADGDRVYATILGTAVNNDGRTSGFMATPGQHGQEAVLRQAYRNAGVSPGRVQYVEAHGTGTRAGDPVELAALGAVLGEGRPPERRCRVGSVKTNIGHTEGAAGIAGLIKVSLSLARGVIPASLHFETPNPDIPWADLPIAVQSAASPWPDPSDVPVAGVSGFGIAGTNAHVVVQAHAEKKRGPETTGRDDRAAAMRLLPISSHTPDTLRETVHDYVRLLAERADLSLDDICYSAGARRHHHPHRVVSTGRSRAELSAGLESFLRNEAHAAIVLGQADVERRRKVAFVFSGQGSQWLGMGRQLLQAEPAFRHQLEACDKAIEAIAGWSVIGQLQASEGDSGLARIDVIQPTLFAVQVSLAALWRSWGIEPEAVVGHSMGEVSAGCAAGALSLEDAARIICSRSALMRRTSGQGAMAVVDLSLDEAAAAIDGFEDRVAVAVSNSPRSSVLSGEPAALDAIIEQLENRDVFCRLVKVDVASHSPQMDPLMAELFGSIQGVRPRQGTARIYSTVMARAIEGTALTPAYWARNLRQPVLFARTVGLMARHGCDVFIEMSPHPLLASAVADSTRDAAGPVVVVPSLRRDEDEQSVIYSSLATLYAAGAEPAWQALCGERAAFVPLPPQHWQRERFWYEGRRSRSGASPGAARHPLIGSRIDSPSPIFETEWSAASLQAFGIGGNGAGPVPAGLIADAAVAAVTVSRGRSAALRHLAIHAPLVVEEQATRVQLVVGDAADGERQVDVYAEGPPDRWTRHATAVVKTGSRGEADARPTSVSLDAVRARLIAEDHGVLVDVLGAAGAISVTPIGFWRGAGEALLAIEAGRGVGEQAGSTRYAGLLEASAAVVAHLGLRSPAEHVASVASIEEPFPDAQAGPPRWIHVASSAGDCRSAAVTFYDEQGRCAGGLARLTVSDQPTGALRVARPAHLASCLYDVSWVPDVGSQGGVAVQPRRGVPSGWMVFLDEQGVGEAAARELERRGCRVARVSRGVSFRSDENGRYTIDPGARDDYARVLAAASDATGAPLGLLHSWSLDIPALASSACSAAIRDRSVASVLMLLHAARVAVVTAPQLWIVTSGAEPAGGAVRPQQAPVWGLGRVLAVEKPESWGGLIDLPAFEPAIGDASVAQPDAGAWAPQIVDVLLDPSSEDQVAIRDGARRHPRFGRATRPAVQPLQFSPDAAYLVTGGLGHLGLAVARWLAANGAGHIVLIGRQTTPRDVLHGVRIRQACDDISGAGARVTIIAADVSSAAGMADLIARFGRELPPLRGVFHAAGIIEFADTDGLTTEDLGRVMAAKVEGSWLLHDLTRERPLDHFVLFSSAAALWGARGLAHYAAANHFLDALAHFRRGLGLPALTVNWALWRDGGTSPQADAFFRQVGLRPMATDAALELLGDLIAEGATERAVADVNWNLFKSVYEARGARPMLEGIRVEARADGEGEGRERDGSEVLREIARSPSDAERLLAAYIRREVAAVLGRSDVAGVDESRGFFKQGMDSLMTVELRRRLERGVGRALPATVAFEYPTVRALAAHLAAVLAAPSAPAPVAASHGGDERKAEHGSASSEPTGEIETMNASQLASALDVAIGSVLDEAERSAS